MRDIVLNLSEQTLSKIGNCDYSNIVRGSNNYLRIVLKTDIPWNNMAKVVTVRTFGGVEYNTIYEPTGVLLSEGSERTDFEPYTGGKPSPSPEYPQEIKAVVNPVIKTHGTNLLDIKDVAETVDKNNGLTYSVQKGIIKVKGTATSSASTGINFMSGVNKKITANNTYIFNPNPTKKEASTLEAKIDTAILSEMIGG